MNGRSAVATAESAGPSRLREPVKLRSFGNRPRRPGFKNSKIDHSSPRWFSTGVPVSARRCSARISRQALADCDAAFLIAWASSRMA